MSIRVNPTTDITPIVKAINELQEQRTRESAETIDLLENSLKKFGVLEKNLK